MNHVRAGGRRMTELIDDLRNVSRVTTSVMRREKVDLRAIAYEVVGDLRRNDPERKVNFVAPAREQAYGDPHLLRIECCSYRTSDSSADFKIR